MLIGAGLGFQLINTESSETQSSPDLSSNCVQPAPVSFDAPQLELQTLSLEPIELKSLRGKTVLLNAWATWCPPCLAELPDLEAYYQEHRDENFVLIGVNIGESQNIVSKFMSEHPINFPIWLDPDEQTLRALNTISLPYSIVIDQAGEVQLAWSGATCLESLENAVTPLLQQGQGGPDAG